MGMQMPSWFDIKGLAPGGEEDESGIKSATKEGWFQSNITLFQPVNFLSR